MTNDAHFAFHQIDSVELTKPKPVGKSGMSIRYLQIRNVRGLETLVALYAEAPEALAIQEVDS